MATSDWNAGAYHRLAGPYEDMGKDVLDRLPLRGDETVIDAGCGSGRVTALLVERLPRGRVIAVDVSPTMVAEARRNVGRDVEVWQADLIELRVPEPVDAVFSTATFHWIRDHERLFERLFAALKPGGRLVAQCGGQGNAQRFFEVVAAVAARPPYAAYLATWTSPWRFAAPAATEALLRQVGFNTVRCWLEARPIRPEDPVAFIETVMLRTHLGFLDPMLHRRFAEEVTAALGELVTLDYVRLNIDAKVTR